MRTYLFIITRKFWIRCLPGTTTHSESQTMSFEQEHRTALSNNFSNMPLFWKPICTSGFFFICALCYSPVGVRFRYSHQMREKFCLKKRVIKNIDNTSYLNPSHVSLSSKHKMLCVSQTAYEGLGRLEFK